MGLAETLVFYLAIGIAVAVAVWSTDAEGPREYRVAERSLRAATALAFWPVYLPILLTPASPTDPPKLPPEGVQPDELSTCIGDVERELDATLSSLDGWAEHTLLRERDRIAELRTAWNWQADRIRQMEEVLGRIAKSPKANSPGARAPEGNDGNDRIQRSELSRRQNLDRLRQVREQACEDLMATLARVRELISLIHLAKFTGAPASRADELVVQIAASVEGLSEVANWRDPPWEECGPIMASGVEVQRTIEPDSRSSALCGESRD
jgi:hypothetical protein